MSETRALMVSAAASGQGKTSVTAALARRFSRAGQRVRVFKTGADFLDPLVLERACGFPVHVLDLWMVGTAHCRRMLERAVQESDLVLVEGVMGLYDGTPSSADLARELALPVLAVIDVQAMAQTVGAIAQGLRDYGPVSVAGIVANGVAGPAHARMLREALGTVPLVGHLPRLAGGLPERHLGLVPPTEVEGLDRLVDALADSLVLDAEELERMPRMEPIAPADRPSPTAAADELPLAGRTIAIARDAAFAFIYPANVECLERLGATISMFSPLANEPVPASASALWLPGGYPELHGERLSGARRFMKSLQAAHQAQLPIWAECGGMMVATDAMVDLDGRRWPMAGLLSGVTRMHAGLKGIGLEAWQTAHGSLRGHTFHHSSFATPLAGIARTVRHPSGEAGESIYRAGSLSASYFHAYFDSCPAAISALLQGVRH